MIITWRDLEQYVEVLRQRNIVQQFKILKEPDEKTARVFLKSRYYEFASELINEQIVEGSKITVETWP